MKKTTEYQCPSCDSNHLSTFYEVKNVPVHSVLLLPTLATAQDYPRRNIVLGFCHRCGVISNLFFDPDVHEYSTRYEETQGYSPTFVAFHQRLAEYLITRYDLHQKEIIEIGCGKGEFLALLCEMGDNHGLGFDPAFDPGRLSSDLQKRVVFIQDFYSEKYANYKGNFVCCKMTLEHIPNAANFVSMIANAFQDYPETIVFFQVPDFGRILEETAFWDIYYEHCSYFTSGSLARLFCRAGFEVIDLWTGYDDQYLMIEARIKDSGEPAVHDDQEDLRELEELVARFAARIDHVIYGWRIRFSKWSKHGHKVVLWGGGSKGVAFLTTLGITLDQVAYTVDINPHKAGTFMAGTGQQIVLPHFLGSYQPDIVIIMNPIYHDEIEGELRQMGLHPEIVCV